MIANIAMMLRAEFEWHWHDKINYKSCRQCFVFVWHWIVPGALDSARRCSTGWTAVTGVITAWFAPALAQTSLSKCRNNCSHNHTSHRLLVNAIFAPVLLTLSLEAELYSIRISSVQLHFFLSFHFYTLNFVHFFGISFQIDSFWLWFKSWLIKFSWIFCARHEMTLAWNANEVVNLNSVFKCNFKSIHFDFDLNRVWLNFHEFYFLNILC